MPLPSELWLSIFGHLPLPDLLSVYHVDRQFRALVPNIEKGDNLILFNLAMEDMTRPVDTPYPISLADRLSYVNEVESTTIDKMPGFKVTIPELYRAVLTQWPVKRPPPGSTWPHAVRFHAMGYCSCDKEAYGDECQCKRRCVDEHNVMLFGSVLDMIWNDVHFDFHDESVGDCRYELFSNPPRLYTDLQNQQTLRFIRMYADDPRWTANGHSNSKWRRLDLPLLRMSRYHTEAEVLGETVGRDGESYMLLDGPARGEIHGWSMGWYDGFEATTYLEWRNDN